jgi:hypothetical protein
MIIVTVVSNKYQIESDFQKIVKEFDDDVRKSKKDGESKGLMFFRKKKSTTTADGMKKALRAKS